MRVEVFRRCGEYLRRVTRLFANALTPGRRNRDRPGWEIRDDWQARMDGVQEFDRAAWRQLTMGDLLNCGDARRRAVDRQQNPHRGRLVGQ